MATTEEVHLRELPDGEEDEEATRRRARRTLRGRANRAVANNFIFNEDQKKFYYERYTCIPDCKSQVGGPPIFILTVTLVELGFFIYYAVTSHVVSWWTISPNAVASPFIFSPYKRQEVWRFLSYMFIHAGLSHILSNIFLQLLIGIPLELVHGSFRVMVIYLIGVLAGSLGSSVFDVGTFLVGASGGDFALLFAYLANVILNWDSMSLHFGIIRVIGVSLFILADFATALYRRYGFEEQENTVSYAAHLAGAAAGLLTGLFILKNFKKQKWEDILMKASIAIFVVCMVAAILFNILCPCYDYYK